MAYIDENGKRVLHEGEKTFCVDCGDPVRKNYGLKIAPKRCRKCRNKFVHEHPEHAPGFKTGKSITDQGYVVVTAHWHPRRNKANGRILEHILVAEKSLGRYLKRSEKVHHINGIKHDNRLQNLIVCKNHKEHFSHHTRPPCMICGDAHIGRGFCQHHLNLWRYRGCDPRGIYESGRWFRPLTQIRNAYKNRHAKHRAHKS